MLAARRRTIVLLDFLAPSLPRRLFLDASQKRKSLEAAAKPVKRSNVDSPELARIPLSVPPASKSQAESYNISIAHIRRAIQANNLSHILERWKLLQNDGLLHFLAHPDLQTITTFVTQLFEDKTEIPPHLEAQVQNLAVYTAALHSHDALNACLLHYLDAEQWETVINIHNRFLEADRKFIDAQSKNSVEGTSEQISDDPTVTDGKPALASDGLGVDTFDRDLTSLGYIKTSLTAVAAYAKLNRLEEAFKVVKENDLHLPIGETSTFLQRFDLQFSAQLSTFIQRIRTASIASLPMKLSRRVKNLSMTPRSARNLESFYNEVITAIEGPDAFLSINPNTPKGCLASVDEVTWTCFLVAFIKTKNERMAVQLWKDIDRLQIKPGVHLFTAFIDACDAVRNVEGAITAWKLMHSRGIAPDNLVFRAMIAALYWGKRKDAAEKAFDAYRATVGRKVSHKDQLIVYNTTLSGMLGLYREDHALNLLTTMETIGPAPDVITYNTFLSFYGRKADFRGLASIVERMASNNVPGDVQSFSTILSALLKVGREDASEMVFGIMKKQGIQPNVVTYTSILQHQLAEKTDRNLKAALRLLCRMEADPALQPTEKTYAVMLKGIRRDQWLPRAQAVQLRDDMLSRIKKRCVKVTEATYNTLISTAFEDSTGQGLEDALVYYQHMKRSGVLPSWRTYYILLSGLRRYQEWTIADEVIADMYLAGSRPGKALMEVARRIKNRE